MDAALVFDAARSAIGGLAVVAGLALMAGGAIGLLRFPDFYTRLHAAGASDGPGAALVLIDSGGVALRLVLLAALWVAAAPTLTHLTASAAHAAGLAPLTGRYAAPRPVARKGAQP
jgi:multicomponent Na+:H+ antiporter subunit G